ncbi:MAG: signal peptidase II [Oscillibacter sp.]|nr:signal peptidase II [Oscillibacter sp.]
MLYLVFSALALALLALDQWVKVWVSAHLALGETAPLLGPVLELHAVHNYGAAWSSFSGQRWLLAGVTGCILLAVAALLARRRIRHPAGLAAAFLILAGGLGNLIDRLRLGYVVDMLHFPFWPSYPTFNVADICVVCGSVLAVVYYLFLHERNGERERHDGTQDPAGS